MANKRSKRKTYQYDVSFFSDTISTIVTTDSTAVTQWISDIMVGTDRLIIGLDTEWGLHTSKEGVRFPVATVQLCVGNRCLIYQICHASSVPSSLAYFLSDSRCAFVGVGVKEDLKKLQKEYRIGGESRHVDLRELAAEVHGRKELKKAGLKSLARLVLDKEMEKAQEVTMSCWFKWRLAPEQVRYACLDAFVSFEIGRVLMNAA